MAYKLSLAFFTVFDCGPVEMIEIASEIGYDMVGLRLLPAIPDEAPYPLLENASVRRETLAALKATGIAVCDVEIVRLKPETEVDKFEPFLAAAAELGARHILVLGDDPSVGRLTGKFADFCRLSHGYGLVANLEFIPYTKVPDLSTARAVVEGASQPNAGVLIDSLHFDRSATTLDDVRVLPRDLVHYAQFCDAPASYDPSFDALRRVSRGERLFPGDGGIDCVSLLRELPPEIVLGLEVPNLELARTISPRDRANMGMAALRRMLASLDER
jgi:sugar phosphate isomerase/epimerase